VPRKTAAAQLWKTLEDMEEPIPDIVGEPRATERNVGGTLGAPVKGWSEGRVTQAISGACLGTVAFL